MQTFLPYSDFKMSAKVLDVKRLGKQRVECLQILKCLKKGEFICQFPPKRTPWYNHPAVRMWKGYESGLLAYMLEICNEWKFRGYKDTCYEKVLEVVAPPLTVELLPNWIEDESFHLSHKSNLLRKNEKHYSQFFIGIPNDLPYKWPINK